MSSYISDNTNKDSKSCQKEHPLEIFIILENLKKMIWLFGIPAWVFGIIDRSIAALADNYLSATEIFHLLIASFLFLCWLCLKPEPHWSDKNIETFQNYQPDSNVFCNKSYFSIAQTRMLELQTLHLISQAYVLPIPYICQIYHLLNLKHLESVHSFSLNHLKVVSVSHFQPTATGGALKFQTLLAAPVNALRIWRQPTVEVELILHTPFTVELSIPVYNGKKIIVIFNIQPLSRYGHKLFIDIYSDLTWHKPLLQLLLHFASCLTLFEDLPYLRTLAQRNLERLVSLNQVATHETLWLFKRFVDLYGSTQETQPIQALS